jgi:hypothetical protein
MKASVNTLHHQVSDWLRETDFYKQEISILEKRLEEVASKNTGQEILARVEHFQNSFILNKEQLDILAHDLRKEENVLEAKAAQSPEHIHQKSMEGLNALQQRMKTFAGSFADLRFDFNTFLSEVM